MNLAMYVDVGSWVLFGGQVKTSGENALKTLMHTVLLWVVLKQFAAVRLLWSNIMSVNYTWKKWKIARGKAYALKYTPMSLLSADMQVHNSWLALGQIAYLIDFEASVYTRKKQTSAHGKAYALKCIPMSLLSADMQVCNSWLPWDTYHT